MSPIVVTNSSPSGRLKRVPAAAASGVTPFFSDSFAGGVVNNANGFVWTPNARLSVSSEQAYSGTHSMKFTHDATALDTNGHQASFELRFALGRKCPVLAIEYYMFVPSNYYHRVNATVSSNNKFMSLWDNDYGGGSGNYRILFQTWQANVYGGLLGDSVLDSAYSGYDQQFISYLDYGDNDHAIRDAGPMTRNAWSRVRVLVTAASGPDVADGRIAIWLNDTKRHDRTNVKLWTHPSGTGISGAPGLSQGYFLGASNSGYTEATNFYLDEFKFYDTDPGWV